MSKISELSDGGALQSTDYLIAVRSGGNVKVQLSELPAGIDTGGNIEFGDNEKAIFGAGSDVRLYHNGATGLFENNTGSLVFTNYADDFDVIIQSDNGSGGVADYFRADGSAGSAILYNYGNQKLATTSTGIDVTGIVTADGLTVDGSGTIATFLRDAGVNGSLTLTFPSQKTTLTSSSGFKINANSADRFDIANNGDISFYEDTGTTAKFFWDASEEYLGIGTSSPFRELEITGTGNVYARITAPTASDSTALELVNTGETWTIRNDDTNSDALEFGTSGGTHLTIDTSGNVGIGTSSPAVSLDIDIGTGNNAIYGRSSDQYCNIGLTDSVGSVKLGSNNGALFFETGGDTSFASLTERLRIDSSGNLLVGKTSTSFSTAGSRLTPDGGGQFIVNGAACVEVNRLSNDGTLVGLYKDGTTVGSIGVTAGPVAYMVFNDTTSDNVAALKGTSGAILPSTNAGADKDGTMDLGSSGARFENLYLSGGVYLGGTGAANLLDDYEEGTWTPALAGATTAGTFSGSVYGRYTKIGNLVYITLRMSAVTLSGATGGIKITGLPFAGNGPNDNYGVTQSMQLYKINFDNTHLQTFYVSGSTLLGLESRSGTTWEEWDVTNSTDMYMNLTAVYDVA